MAGCSGERGWVSEASSTLGSPTEWPVPQQTRSSPCLPLTTWTCPFLLLPPTLPSPPQEVPLTQPHGALTPLLSSQEPHGWNTTQPGL